MSGWDAIAASVSGVNPAAYGLQGGTMFRPVGRPTEQTDDNLITVPVLDLVSLGQQRKLSDTSASELLSTGKPELKRKTKGRSISDFIRGKASNFNSLSDRKVHITMRHVTRREYFKHYAKDDHGGYVGTEDPAKDCILNEDDSARWRGATDIQLMLPFSGVGVETGKETEVSQAKYASAGTGQSAMAVSNTPTVDRKQKRSFFSFKGEKTEREVVR
ncbi:hypothetical protein H2200_007669 [Cladophialophora chaetospira]|uniref:Uncharacterized protein n=1 Tax=Cladophialophora chaetospira TaxID=386627 RepID=A0AA38X6M1_9EURO|nr:hypothetical protein H2200_007669 [Cladophialophora chaetospira]